MIRIDEIDLDLDIDLGLEETSVVYLALGRKIVDDGGGLSKVPLGQSLVDLWQIDVIQGENQTERLEMLLRDFQVVLRIDQIVQIVLPSKGAHPRGLVAVDLAGRVVDHEIVLQDQMVGRRHQGED